MQTETTTYSAEPAARSDRFMAIIEVMKTSGTSRSTVYEWVKRGILPKPRKLGPRRVGWLASEMAEWVKSREISRARPTTAR
jgi:prophage regulatory protein